MKKAMAYLILGFLAIGMLLTTGCFETTAHNVYDFKSWTEATFLDGDGLIKTTR